MSFPAVNCLLFDRFPVTTIGAYGGSFHDQSATPALDRLATDGVLFDNVFVTSSAPQNWQSLDHVTALAFDDAVFDVIPWLGANTWPELLQAWRDDGIELPDDMTANAFANEFFRRNTTAHRGADIDDPVAELFDLDFLFACDAAAEYLRSVDLAKAAAADQMISKFTENNVPVVLTAAQGATPAGLLDSPLFDTWRHVPLVVCGGDAKPRRVTNFLTTESVRDIVQSGIADPLSALEANSSDGLIFQAETGDAVRDATGLYLQEHASEAGTQESPRERFFVKPDDRWNQLDLADQLGDRLDPYRERLASAVCDREASTP